MNVAQSTCAGPPPLTQADLAHFAGLVGRETGIKMPLGKAAMLQGRLMRRLRTLGLDTFSEYREYLADPTHGPSELIHFIDAVTTNKTDFFREPVHFTYLAETILPGFSKRHPNQRFNVWSAACSTGEEPYTTAMILEEHVRREPGFSYALLGTDLSSDVLDRARQGIYDEERIAPVAYDLRKRYFRRSSTDPSVVRVIPELRERVSFHRLNLMTGHYPVRTVFDVIFVRNVLIYFERDVQVAVVERLCRHLRPAGYLISGHSDSLTTAEIGLETVGPAIFRKVT